MATVTLQLDPVSGKFRTSAFPQIVQANGSNYPVSGLAFDAAADEEVYFPFVATEYGSGNVTVRVFWYADTATSGAVVWAAQLAAITPNTDTQDIETDGLGTAATVTDTHLGTTGQRLHSADISVSSLDSLADGDYVTLKLYRDANAGGDTLAGDAIVTRVVVEYSDS